MKNWKFKIEENSLVYPSPAPTLEETRLPMNQEPNQKPFFLKFQFYISNHIEENLSLDGEQWCCSMFSAS